VDGLEGPGVAQREGDLVVAAGVGQPVPAVDARAADDEPLAEGGDGLEERLGSGGEVAGVALLAVAVEDGEDQRSGVEIDAGIESGVGGRQEETPEGLRFGGATGGGWVPPPSSQTRAFMSIQRLKPTGAAILVFRASTSMQAAPAA
jgi:hypothetical protein